MDGNKVLLIDSQQLSREGLRLLLAGEGYDVVGATRSLDEAGAAIGQGLRPDLVLLALGHPGESQHIAALQQIRAGFADFKFVIIAPEVSSALLAQCVEAGVNACLLRGYSNKMIARELDISDATVKVHLKALLRKLKAHNRTQAAIWAMENGYAANGATPARPAAGSAA